MPASAGLGVPNGSLPGLWLIERWPEPFFFFVKNTTLKKNRSEPHNLQAGDALEVPQIARANCIPEF